MKAQPGTMKTIKSEIKLDQEEFNSMPGREVIEKYMGDMPVSTKYVDVTDRDYWQNNHDTLVFEIDGEDMYRFGGKSIAESIQAVIALTQEAGADEVHTELKGAKLIVRMWWD